MTNDLMRGSELANSLHEPIQYLTVDPLILLIASWNFPYLGRKVVANWMFSSDGLDLYQSLLEKLRFRATNTAEFVLSLTAMLARQLIPGDPEDHTSQHGDYAMADFNGMVHGRPQRNTKTIIAISLSALIRALAPHDAVHNMIKRLSKNLVEEVLILEPLESTMNTYWERRLGGRSDEDAYKIAELIEREETSGEYDNELTVSAQHGSTVDNMPETWFIDNYHGFDLEQDSLDCT